MRLQANFEVLALGTNLKKISPQLYMFPLRVASCASASQRGIATDLPEEE